MNQGSRPHSSADPEPVVIGPATESDLPAIVGVLNDAIVNSNANPYHPAHKRCRAA